MGKDVTENVVKGCIRGGKGPWLVHRTTRDGSVVTRFRYPSERERQNNKKRERVRRAVTRNIFAGLRAHGNYHLPRHADSNDLLKALCNEAGWDVDDDGNISRKKSMAVSSINVKNDYRVSMDAGQCLDDEDYCKCNDVATIDSKSNVGGDGELQSAVVKVISKHDEYEINLALSLSPSQTLTESN